MRTAARMTIVAMAVTVSASLPRSAGAQTPVAASSPAPPRGALKLTIGNPIAVMTPDGSASQFKVKLAAAPFFVVRVDGCEAPSAAQVSGRADGVVNGVRQTFNVAGSPIATSPGVFGVQRSWPVTGSWVVSLTASCKYLSAGAIVPVTATGFVRDAITLLPRATTPADIDAALKAR